MCALGCQGSFFTFIRNLTGKDLKLNRKETGLLYYTPHSGKKVVLTKGPQTI